MNADQSKAIAAYCAMTAEALRDDAPVRRFNSDAEQILADMRARMYADPDSHFPDVAASRALAEYLAVTRAGREGPIDREALAKVPNAELNLMASDPDAKRESLRDAVPFSAKVLAHRTRKFLSVSVEYGERVANPRNAETGRKWFGMSAAERKHLLAFEKATGYFVNREDV